MNPMEWLMRLFRPRPVDLLDNVSSEEKKRADEAALRAWQTRAEATRQRVALQADRT